MSKIKSKISKILLLMLKISRRSQNFFRKFENLVKNGKNLLENSKNFVENVKNLLENVKILSKTSKSRKSYARKLTWLAIHMPKKGLKHEMGANRRRPRRPSEKPSSSSSSWTPKCAFVGCCDAILLITAAAGRLSSSWELRRSYFDSPSAIASAGLASASNPYFCRAIW